jgi:hypothetical protein
MSDYSWQTFLKHQIDEIEGTPIHDEFKYLGVLSYVRDRRTIGLCLPRRSGKTKFIAENAKCGDLVICANLLTKDHVERYFRVRVNTVNELSSRRSLGFRSRPYPFRIWLDEPDRMPRCDLDEALHNAIVSPEQIVIRLGTV